MLSNQQRQRLEEIVVEQNIGRLKRCHFEDVLGNRVYISVRCRRQMRHLTFHIHASNCRQTDGLLPFGSL